MEFLPIASILTLIIFAIPLSIIDIREHRLPNVFTYSAIAVSLATVSVAGISTQDWGRLAIALGIGAATALIGYLMAAGNAIGMGDVKLLIACHLSIGWFSPWLVLAMLAIGFGLAALLSLGLLVARKANFKTALAMGPFLLAGFLFAAFEISAELVTEAALS